jgi:hypothetical protein
MVVGGVIEVENDPNAAAGRVCVYMEQAAPELGTVAIPWRAGISQGAMTQP